MSARTGPDIVCFSSGLTRGPRAVGTVVRQLARHHQVLWVHVPGEPAPRGAGPPWRAWDGVWEAASGVRRLAAGLHALAPVRVPPVGAGGQRLDAALLRWQVARAMRRLGLARPVVWAFRPGAAPVLGALGEVLVVYHLLEDAAGEVGDPAPAPERDLLRRADLVLVSSERSLAARRRQHRRVVLVRAESWAARVTLMRAHVAALLDGRAALAAPARGGTEACPAP